jgi:hypothetical protein
MYAFEGTTIKLTEHGLRRWQIAYPGIPDLRAELQKADDYYTENPPKDGKWFFPVSRWLANENAKHRLGTKQSTREIFSNALQSIGSPTLRADAFIGVSQRESDRPAVLFDQRNRGDGKV